MLCLGGSATSNQTIRKEEAMSDQEAQMPTYEQIL